MHSLSVAIVCVEVRDDEKSRLKQKERGAAGRYIGFGFVQIPTQFTPAAIARGRRRKREEDGEGDGWATAAHSWPLLPSVKAGKKDQTNSGGPRYGSRGGNGGTKRQGRPTQEPTVGRVSPSLPPSLYGASFEVGTPLYLMSSLSTEPCPPPAHGCSQ